MYNEYTGQKTSEEINESWHERRMLRIGCDGDDPLWQPLIEVAKINRSL